MLPIMRKMREKKDKPASAGISIVTRQSDYNESDKQTSEAIEQCTAHMLIAIAAKDPKALAEAMVAAHDAMHAEWDKQSDSPHTYEHQNIKAGETY